MRVFLTGGSGYLGRVLLRRISSHPEVEGITAIANTEPPAVLPPKTRYCRVDVRSPEVGKLVRGHDVVVHTASVVLWSRGMPASERDSINLDGTRNVAQAALAAGVKRFVHASSMAVYDPERVRGQSLITEDFPLGEGRSRYYYWNAKALQERLLMDIFHSSDSILTLLRPIYVMGPTNQTAARSYRTNAVMFPGRNPRRQFVHEEDVAAAFLMAILLDLPGAFNVVPNDFVRMRDTWSMAGARVVPILPVWLAKAITWIRWRYLGSPVHPNWIEDMLLDFTASNGKMKSAGWQPQYSSVQAFRSAYTREEKKAEP